MKDFIECRQEFVKHLLEPSLDSLPGAMGVQIKKYVDWRLKK